MNLINNTSPCCSCRVSRCPKMFLCVCVFPPKYLLWPPGQGQCSRLDMLDVLVQFFVCWLFQVDVAEQRRILSLCGTCNGNFNHAHNALSLTSWPQGALKLHLEMHLTCMCLLFLWTVVSMFIYMYPHVSDSSWSCSFMGYHWAK